MRIRFLTKTVLPFLTEFVWFQDIKQIAFDHIGEFQDMNKHVTKNNYIHKTKTRKGASCVKKKLPSILSLLRNRKIVYSNVASCRVASHRTDIDTSIFRTYTYVVHVYEKYSQKVGLLYKHKYMVWPFCYLETLRTYIFIRIIRIIYIFVYMYRLCCFSRRHVHINEWKKPEFRLKCPMCTASKQRKRTVTSTRNDLHYSSARIFSLSLSLSHTHAHTHSLNFTSFFLSFFLSFWSPSSRLFIFFYNQI